MSTLKEKLSSLSTALPGLRTGVHALVTESQAMDGSLSSFLDALEETEARAGELSRQVVQALAELRAQSHEERVTTIEETVDLEGEIGSSLASLDQQQGLLDQAVAAAGTATTQLTRALTAAATGLSADVEASAAPLAALALGTRESGDTLQAAGDAAAAAANALRLSLADTSTSVGQAVAALDERLRALREAAAERTARTAQKLQRLQDAHAAELADGRARLGEGQAAILAEMRGRIETDMLRLLDTATAPAGAALAELAAAAMVAADGSHEGRESLGALFARLRQATHPLRPAIDSVKEAAERVGLPWS